MIKKIKDKAGNEILQTLVIIAVIGALAITVADIPLVLDSDRGFFANVKTPEFIVGCEWSTWEFFTGFFLGLLIMLIIVLLPKKYTNAEENYTYEIVWEV